MHPLLGGHVLRCSQALPLSGSKAGGIRWIDCLGNAKVNDLHNGTVSVTRYQDVAGLQIAMNDALLVRVLHAGTHINEEAHAVTRTHATFVTEGRDSEPINERHDKPWSAIFGGASVKHRGNMRVIHERQGVAFVLKSGKH